MTTRSTRGWLRLVLMATPLLLGAWGLLEWQRSSRVVSGVQTDAGNSGSVDVFSAQFRGRTLEVLSDDAGGAAVWDVEKGLRRAVRRLAKVDALRSAWSADGTALVISQREDPDDADSEGRIEARSWPQFALRLKAKQPFLFVPQYLAARNEVIVVSEKGIRVLSAVAEQPERVLPLPCRLDLVRGIAGGPDDRTLAVFTLERTYLIASDTGKVLGSYSGFHTTLNWSPDRSRLAVHPSNAMKFRAAVTIWDLVRNQTICRLPYVGGGNHGAWSPNGHYYALVHARGRYWVQGKDNQVSIWDVARNRKIGTLVGPTGWIRAVQFSADSRTVWAVTDTGAVWKWENAVEK